MCGTWPQKTILRSGTVTIPDGVDVTIKARKIVVKGPRGTLSKDLSHLPLDIRMEGKTITIERWFTSGKAPASIRTACSHIDNLIIGVTKVRARALWPLPLVGGGLGPHGAAGADIGRERR